MKIYLVGGAVRDKLLGRPIKERDYVVVGSTAEEMLRLGFKKVGKDFPVFLHPQTHEEYALARTEKKIARGYYGFTCHAQPTVTLEEDLERRDLTINAMAEDAATGRIIDPHGGMRDLKKKILRHTSPAFSEDPVRILRAARFAARLDNFKISRKTNELMQSMVANGEIDALVPERVWQELIRALREDHPEKFFMVLNNCGALAKLFPPMVKRLRAIIDTLRRAVQLETNDIIRFASLATNLHGAEITALCNRYKVPRCYRDLALVSIKLRDRLKKIILSPKLTVALLEQMDAYRRPLRFQQILLVYSICTAEKKPRNKFQNILQQSYETTKDIRLDTGNKTTAQNYEKKLSQILHDLRVKALEQK